MTLPLEGLAFLNTDGKIPDANLPAPPVGGITTLTGDGSAGPGSGSQVFTISPAIAAAISAAAANASTALAQIAALATVASTGSAADLTGTLNIARIADASITQAKLASFLAAIATSGSASDLTAGTLDVARIAAATITQDKLGGSFAASYPTGELDWLTTSSGNTFVPAYAGYYFVALSIRPFVTQRTGTATGNLTISAGNNAGESNLINSTAIAASNFNTAAAPFNPTGVSVNQGATTAVATTAYTLKITGAATGASVLKGKLVVSGTWVPQ